MSDPIVYGVLDRAALATRTGREVLQAIVDGALPQAPISETLGFWLVAVGDGTAAFEGEPGPHLRNPLGTVHGGWALTLLDSVAACAAHSLLPAGVGYTTLETKANFTRAITPASGRVRAEAKVVAAGKQITTCEAWLRDRDGQVLAHGTSTIMTIGAR